MGDTNRPFQGTRLTNGPTKETLACPYCDREWRGYLFGGLAFWRSLIHTLRCDEASRNDSKEDA